MSQPTITGTPTLWTELRSEARWLSSGFLLTLCSGAGQTYFIAIFAGHLKTELGLSDGGFGGLYTAGTLASAALLTWAGKLPDKFPIRWVGAGVLAGLALTSLGMAAVNSAWMLVIVLFGLRFFGQGMATHTAMTAMGRWYNRKRGRAISIAGLGISTSEALTPMIAVALIGLVGWRQTWVVIAIVLLVVPLPIFITLLKRKRVPTITPVPAHGSVHTHIRHEWTRGEVLRHALFYALMPAMMATPFIFTGIFINQVTIVALKGWQLSWFAASFPLLAGVNVLAALGAGWLVDKVGARHLLPLFLLPLGISCIIMAYAQSGYWLPVFMGVAGLTLGIGSTMSGALWPELYGTEHLGAIRAVATAVMVFATALSPGLIGVLLDAGVSMETMLLVMAGYCAAASLWTAALMRLVEPAVET